MKKTVRNEEGYTILLTLSLILVLMLALSAVLLLSAAWKSRASALERRFASLKEADELLKELEESMQALATDECDTFDTENYNFILSKYSDYFLTLTDISSGVSTKFWSKKITESPAIRKLLSDHAETEYSWLPKDLSNEETLKESLESSRAESVSELFPLVNDLPLVNIYSLDAETVLAILEALKIKDFEEKALKIFESLRVSNIKDEEIAEILSVPKTSQTMEVFGTKTTFWRAKFVTETCSVNAVFAALPYKNEKPRSVEKYILFEKNIEYKRGKL